MNEHMHEQLKRMEQFKQTKHMKRMKEMNKIDNKWITTETHE